VKTLVVVQARVGSSRLPGKVLLPVAGAPLLERLIERLRAAESSFSLVVATTTAVEDEPIRALCRKIDVDCMSGHPKDLLDRHYEAARLYHADAVCKVPSDCPLIDPGVLDRVLLSFESAGGQCDFASNLHPATYPDGNDVEVMTMEALSAAWREAWRPFEREHTTPFLWERPERFRLLNVAYETGQNLSMSYRFTIDYPEDYAFVARVYDSLWREGRPVFRLGEILHLLREQPEIAAINAHLAGVNWYRNHLGELKTVSKDETRFEGVA